MSRKVKWGVLGVASIATRKVIPGMQKGECCDIAAIASRDPERAKHAAAELGISKSYGSYEALLADPEIEAVYNPLPNHLHLPWSARAAEAGKHVLCEKPIALNVTETLELMRVRDRTGVKIGEAFMVKTHPQWLRVKELAQGGAIGQLKSITTIFSYYNRDPQNVRHKPQWGGGGLLDIGSYPITLSRWLFNEEPWRVTGVLELDPDFGTDRLASGILEFSSGHSVFACGTQTNYYQRMELLGTTGRLAVDIPFNAPNDRPTQITVADGMAIYGGKMEIEQIPTCDQYTIQGDAFSRAIRENIAVPVPLEDALGNMKVIDAIFRASKSGRWETL
ncbi:MAG TPA: Gfo/Idh/MocA family oxidoreductase [Candidatus Eisenbacteria bacterium]|jgi:predicted dehydrogenase|nr:Gfo/Idh/MocA family oxidoreductase [Candidatus Eisenbacteria bacterium]